LGDEVGEYVVVDFIGGRALTVRSEEERADVAAEVWRVVSQEAAKDLRKTETFECKSNISIENIVLRTYFWRSSVAMLLG